MNASAAVAASETVRNRRFRRVPESESLLITWQCPGVREASQGIGLNQGGVFIETQQPQPVGTTLKLKVPNPGGDIQLNGIVRDSVPDKGMGVEFANIGNKERAKLDVVVKRRLLAAEAARKEAGASAKEQPAKSANKPGLAKDAKASGKAVAPAAGKASAPPKGSAAAAKQAAATIQAGPAAIPTKEKGPKGRRFPRINLPKGMKVAWQSGQQKEITVVGTVGLGGLFITSAQPPAVGSKLRLLFDVPGGEVLATALVRDSIPGRGMGVEFLEISPEARRRIEEFLDRLMS